MDTEYERSRIEQLKRGLYSPGDDAKAKHEAELSPSDVDVANNWEDATIVRVQGAGAKAPTAGALKKLVMIAVATAVLSGGYLVYQYFDPFARPSEKNIDITFVVPPGVTPGIPADVVLQITNKNRVALDYATLTLSYPSGTRSGDDPDKDMREEKKSLGLITAGATVNYRTKAVFLGEENSSKEIHATLEYRFAGINSIFTKDEVRPVQILAAPVNITIDMLKEINAGQPVELAVSVTSNTVIPLRDVLVKIDYPLGFTYTEAFPKPDFGTNIWRTGVLTPGGKFTFKVRGVMTGAEGEEKVFHTSAGAGSDKTMRDIETLYSKVLSSLSLTRSFIGIELLLNGKSTKDISVPFGTRVEGTVNWRNNIDARIEDAEIDVKLSGAALNRTSVVAGTGGFYRSGDDTIVWDSRGNTALALLESGAQGVVSFFFRPLPPVSGTQTLQNPTITAEVTVRGKRVSESGVPEEVKSVIIESVRVSSEVQFASRAVYYVGPFANSGPIPPRVETETTYTLIWSIVNTSNTINNTEVRAVLPVYVKWYGAVSPENEQIVYNPRTNEVVWSPGTIAAGTGIGKPPREVAFQVVLTPSLSQVKLAPSLITNTILNATDAFTGVPIHQEKPNATTMLSTDPKAAQESDVVVP
jgi:hypothetical protein